MGSAKSVRKLSTSGEQTRLFARSGCGEPWTYIGCAGMTNLGIPGQVQFSRCVGKSGLEVSAVRRRPDPREFTVTLEDNFLKLWNMYQANSQNGCPVDLLIASAICADQKRITDPTYGDVFTAVDGVTLTNLDIGGDTILTIDPNDSANLRWQVQGFPGAIRVYGKPTTGLFGTGGIAGPITSFAFADEGKCADLICSPNEVVGCQMALVKTSSAWLYTGDGFQSAPTTVAALSATASSPGHAQAFNGVLFAVQNDVSPNIGLSVNGTTFTDATTDVAFTTLSNIVAIDRNYLIVGGEQGAVWASQNGGGAWTRIRPANALTPRMDRLAVAPDGRVYAIGSVAGAQAGDPRPVSILVSDDQGRTFRLLEGAAGLEYDPATGSLDLVADASGAWAVIDQNLYHVSHNGGVDEVVVPGAAGFITGVGVIDPNVCGAVYVTYARSATAAGLIYTLDGFVSKPVDDPITGTGLSLRYGPTAVCNSRNGSQLVYAIGGQMRYARDFESFFS